MADAPSTSSVKNRKTNYDFSDGFVKIKKRRYIVRAVIVM